MFSMLARAFLLRRLFGRRDTRRGHHYSSRRPRHGAYRGYGRHRSRSGFGTFGPFPTYSGRTRRGTRVSVGGCCLPIPLALTALLAAGLRLGAASARRR